MKTSTYAAEHDEPVPMESGVDESAGYGGPEEDAKASEEEPDTDANAAPLAVQRRGSLHGYDMRRTQVQRGLWQTALVLD